MTDCQIHTLEVRLVIYMLVNILKNHNCQWLTPSSVQLFKVLDGVKHKTWTLRKKMKMLKEARGYTAKFEGKLSKSGGPGQFARFKVSKSR